MPATADYLTIAHQLPEHVRAFKLPTQFLPSPLNEVFDRDDRSLKEENLNFAKRAFAFGDVSRAGRPSMEFACSEPEMAKASQSCA